MRHDFIPGYRVDRLIGKGGMAAVYLAIQESVDRPVALKVMRDPDSAEFSVRFVNEGRIVASLVHSNIITVHDVGIAEGLHYIAMEYVDGGDLKARIADGLSPEAALTVAVRIAGCLGFAHRKGVIHRDLKPANILFRRDGTPLLTDFGIAKSLRLDRDLTVTGRIIGTPRYMSPEQALGKSVDGRSDLYSLGIVLYEMLAGEPPYTGSSEVDTILRHLNDPFPALPAACRRYQPLLERMLAKDPAARFADAAELCECIAAMHGGGRRAPPRQTSRRPRPPPPRAAPSTPKGSPAPARTGRPLRAWRALVLSSAGVAAAAALGIAFFHDGGQQGRSTAGAQSAAAGPATARTAPATAQPETGPDALHLYQRALDYRQGRGVPPDDHKAAELFSRAAEQGHAGAQYYLGLMSAEGRGVAQELGAAARWFERAARQNLVDGQYYLCLSYALGRGVSRDRVAAYAWCRVAEDRGSRDAQESLEAISKLLPDPQIREAEALALSIAASLDPRPPVLLGAPLPPGGEALDAADGDSPS